MIFGRVIPMLMMLGTAALGLILVLTLMGVLGLRYWSARPISLTPETPEVFRALPVPVQPARPRMPSDGMV